MKKISKKLCIFLVITIVFTGTFAVPIAFATEEDLDSNFQIANGDESLNTESIVEVPSSLITQISDGEYWIDLTDFLEEEEIILEPTYDDIAKGALSSERAIDLTQRTANSRVTPQSRNPWNYIDSIPVAGAYNFYGPFLVATGEMIEAIMYTPVKAPVQYELSIVYSYDGISWYLGDYSNSGTGGNIIFESVGLANPNVNAMYCYVFVDALTNGDGNDTYDLTVAISTGYDNYEPNNSIVRSFVYSVPNLTPTQYVSYSANLHSALDVDWIRFDIPQNTSLTALHFFEDNTANVTYELFQFVNGAPIRMTKGSDGQYTVMPNQSYYYRISSKNTATAYPRNCGFELRAYQVTTSVLANVTMNSNPLPTQTYSTFGTRYTLLSEAFLEVTVYYLTANGSVINVTENSDVVTVSIINSAWNYGTYNHTKTAQGNASRGVTYVPLTIGQVFGQITVQTQYSIWFYDYSVTLDISSSKFNNLLRVTIPASIPLYLTTRMN